MNSFWPSGAYRRHGKRFSLSSDTRGISLYHWNGYAIILMKFSSLAAVKVVKMTTFSAAGDENSFKMTTFSIPCLCNLSPANTQRNKHVILTPKLFTVIITYLLRRVFPEGFDRRSGTTHAGVEVNDIHPTMIKPLIKKSFQNLFNLGATLSRYHFGVGIKSRMSLHLDTFPRWPLPHHEFIRLSTVKITTLHPVNAANMGLSQYRDRLSSHGDFYYKDETVVRPSYLYSGNSFTGKTVSLYWGGALVTNRCNTINGVANIEGYDGIKVKPTFIRCLSCDASFVDEKWHIVLTSNESRGDKW